MPNARATPSAGSWDRVRYLARRRVLDSPTLAMPFLARRPAYAERLVGEGVELVADGFPRSANSYFRVAFTLAQGEGTRIAGHAHSSQLLLQGAGAGLAAVLLIRDPEPVVASYLQYATALRPRDVIGGYLRFHRRLRPHLDELYVADFAAVTGDLGAVIRGVNARFGTSFADYVKSEANEQEVRERLDQVSRRRHGDQVAEHRVSRPSAHRVPASEVVAGLPRADRELLREAGELYASIVGDRTAHGPQSR